MKLARVWLVAIFLVVITLFLTLNRPPTRRESLHNALILQKVQALGELHTARYSYQDVFDYRTSAQPAEWVAYVPGGESLVRGATSNKALISAVGSVEAGVDLRQAKVTQDARGIHVSIPAPTVYEPTIRAWARDVRYGLLWRDDNLGLKASDEAKKRFRAAAVRQGILDQARQEAEKSVVRLLAPLGMPVQVSVGEAGSQVSPPLAL